MLKEIQKKFFVSEIVASKYVYYKLSLLRREYLPSTVNRSTKSPKILDITQRDSFNLNFLSQRIINMVNALSFNFDQCFGPFTMLFLEGPSKTGHF